MSTDPSAGTLATRLDKLYEFERAPITEDRLHSGRHFAGLFAGEHVAATEFVIGALFVQWGVGARDLIWGLVLGNLLAVLSWGLICAPIAVRTRLTLYWYAKRIIGPGLTVVYNFVNAMLYCCLAAAMIGVSASAVILALSKFGLDIDHPTLADRYPNSVGWVVVVLLVGAVVVTLAIAGFEKLSNFASICSPWMFLVFIAGGLASLPKLGEFHSIGDIWQIAETKVWRGEPHENPLRKVTPDLLAGVGEGSVPAGLRDDLAVEREKEDGKIVEPVELTADAVISLEKAAGPRWHVTDGDDKYVIKHVTVQKDLREAPVLQICEVKDRLSFWHIMFFAWFCNLAMHVGLSDMALFRYAKHWSYGFYSGFGMYLGHFVAWVCAGLMGAAVGRGLNPGQMADTAAGMAGVIAVLLAGWTTANPTIYRAGLALQIVTPNWPRWKVTLAAGGVTAVVGCFPAIFMKLLDFVAIYGLMLMPIGAVIVCEHWLFPKLRLRQYWTDKRKLAVNVPALIAWVVVLVLCFPIELWSKTLRSPMDLIGLHLFFRWLPGWFIAAGIYTGICKWRAASLGTALTDDDARTDEPVSLETSAPAATNDGAAFETPPSRPAPTLKYRLAGLSALIGLILCVLLPLRVFLGDSPRSVEELVGEAIKNTDADSSAIHVPVADVEVPDPQDYADLFGGKEPVVHYDEDRTTRIFDYSEKSLIFTTQTTGSYTQNMRTYKSWFLLATVLYFAGAIVWFTERQRAKDT